MSFWLLPYWKMGNKRFKKRRRKTKEKNKSEGEGRGKGRWKGRRKKKEEEDDDDDGIEWENKIFRMMRGKVGGERGRGR